MTAPYMQGLLGPGAFNPTLPPNLLQMLGQPGRPAAQMAQNMAQVQQPSPAGRAAPNPAPPAPPPPPAAPPRTYGATGSAATDTGLLAGGITAMRAAQGGQQGSLGAALGEGLAAGSLAFTARKDAEADAAQQAARQAAYAKRVGALGLPPEIAAGVIGMGEAEGSKMLAQFGIDVTKEMLKPEKLAPGDKLYRKDGSVIAENIKPDEPFDVAKMSPQARDAFQMVLRRDIRDPQAFGAPLSPTEAQQVNDWIAAQDTNRANKTSLSVNAQQADPAAKTMWTQGASQLTQEYNDEIRVLPERIDIFDAVLGDIERGNYFSGSLSDIRRRAAQFGDLIGMTVNTDKVTNSQTLLSELRNAALRRLPELDSRPTDKDMEILIEAVGSMDMTPEALTTVFQRARDRAVRGVERYKDRVAAFEQDFEGTGYRVPAYLKTIDLPTRRSGEGTDGAETPQQRAARLLTELRRGSGR